MAALDIVTPAVALPIGLSPPSSSSHLGVPAAPQTSVLSLLADSCGLQPPSTSNGGTGAHACGHWNAKGVLDNCA